jgi:hypothetical protein
MSKYEYVGDDDHHLMINLTTQALLMASTSGA